MCRASIWPKRARRAEVRRSHRQEAPAACGSVRIVVVAPGIVRRGDWIGRKKIFSNRRGRLRRGLLGRNRRDHACRHVALSRGEFSHLRLAPRIRRAVWRPASSSTAESRTGVQGPSRRISKGQDSRADSSALNWRWDCKPLQNTVFSMVCHRVACRRAACTLVRKPTPRPPVPDMRRAMAARPPDYHLCEWHPECFWSN